MAAFEELGDGVDLLGVKAAVDVDDAGGGAALDLVLEARALAARELDVAAGAKLEVLVDEVQRAARRGGRVVGPEVARAVGRGTADDFEARPDAFGHAAEAEGDEVFVVAEFDVVLRAVLLDEVVLEDRRFLLVRRDDRVEVSDGRLEDRDEGAEVALGVLEVAPHTGAQALGLADVDDDVLLVPEEVNARLRREGVELLDDDVGEHGRQDSRVTRDPQ